MTLRDTTQTYALPAFVAACLAAGLLGFMSAYVLALALGIGALLVVAYRDVRTGNWSLDYIAFLAMALSAATHAWLAGAVIALMYVGGESLEAYASKRATHALSALLARLPKTASVQEGSETHELPLAQVRESMVILVRRGELVPLDGFLVSARAVLDLSSLTGEAIPETVAAGAFIKSGAVNAGDALTLRVSGTLATSTYAKIVDLVRTAAHDRAPFVRLAARANLPFTLATLLIAGAAFLLTHDLIRVLAVLVIATPCPLIIAAPVAFVGGLSRAARKNIIVKRPAALELATRVSTIFFDKTGTLTLGTPQLVATETASGFDERRALSLAASLEFHSIHPTARAIVAAAKKRGITPAPAEHVSEELGVGIAGMVAAQYAAIEPAARSARRPGHISLALTLDGDRVAVFHLADSLKSDALETLASFPRAGMQVAILTGDSKANAEEMLGKTNAVIHAELVPEEKYALVDAERAKGRVVAMVGDGLNDAPALARADVGIVFSGTENSASIEAADIAVLNRDMRAVGDVFAIARRSVRVAKQSVYIGIGLSLVGQVVAAFGFIVPVEGAVLQELIDTAVILNALRAAYSPRT